MRDRRPFSERVTADRPVMPGYGVATDPAGMLPWSWAEERIAASTSYWLATVDGSGEPHLAAVWAVWFDDALWFSTGGRSRKGRNLAATHRCAISAASTEESVVLTGHVARITDTATIAAVETAYVAKYGTGFPEPDENPLFRFGLRTVIAVLDREDEFSRTATRWTVGD